MSGHEKNNFRDSERVERAIELLRAGQPLGVLSGAALLAEVERLRADVARYTVLQTLVFDDLEIVYRIRADATAQLAAALDTHKTA